MNKPTTTINILAIHDEELELTTQQKKKREKIKMISCIYRSIPLKLKLLSSALLIRTH